MWTVVVSLMDAAVPGRSAAASAHATGGLPNRAMAGTVRVMTVAPIIAFLHGMYLNGHSWQRWVDQSRYGA
jgi:hypothetical protein